MFRSMQIVCADDSPSPRGSNLAHLSIVGPFIADLESAAVQEEENRRGRERLWRTVQHNQQLAARARYQTPADFKHRRPTLVPIRSTQTRALPYALNARSSRTKLSL